MKLFPTTTPTPYLNSSRLASSPLAPSSLPALLFTFLIPLTPIVIGKLLPDPLVPIVPSAAVSVSNPLKAENPQSGAVPSQNDTASHSGDTASHSGDAGVQP